MRLEATTQINYDAFRRFFLFNLVRGKRSPLQALVLVIMAPALLVLFLFFYLHDPTDIVNVAGMAIMLLLCLTILTIIFVLPRRFYRSMSDKFAWPIHYVFSDEQYEAWQVKPDRARQKNPPGSADNLAIRYEMLANAYETRNFFYLYINRRQISIIAKKNIAGGHASDLRALLQAKLKGRFRTIAN